MKKVFNFGKIDFYGNGRKINAVSVEMCYEDGRLAICGDIWNAHHTDCVSCGQNLDTIREYVSDPTFLELYDLWKNWHLNDMHAGTEKQERIIKNWLDEGNAYNYDEACRVLVSCGMYVDESYIHNGKPYRYGTAWLKREIPADVEERINNLFNLPR